VSEKKPIIQQVYAISTPIFTKEMGYRMSMMRENLMLDQAMLAQKLGTTQQTISKLERGIQSTTRAPFSIAKLFDVFGDAILHILLGTGEQRFNYGLIHNKYLTKMYKKRGFGAAKHGIKSELN
jgi:DNA-binding XRE family transcriptional regulator